MSKPPPGAKPTMIRTVLCVKKSSVAEIPVPAMSIRLKRNEHEMARFLFTAFSPNPTPPTDETQTLTAHLFLMIVWPERAPVVFDFFLPLQFQCFLICRHMSNPPCELLDSLST